MNSAVLNAELTHSARQNIIQAFNQGVVDLLIATDAGLVDDTPKETARMVQDEDWDWKEGEEEEEPQEPEDTPRPKKKLKRKRAKQDAAEVADEANVQPEATGKKTKLKKTKKKAPDSEVGDAEEVPPKAKRKRKKKKLEEDAEVPATDEAAPPPAEEAKKETEVTIREKRKKFGARSKHEADEAYSMTRGVDLYNVSTVINADIPLRVRD